RAQRLQRNPKGLAGCGPHAPPPTRLGPQLAGKGLRLAECSHETSSYLLPSGRNLLDGFVAFDLSVADMDDTMSVSGDVVLVCHQDDGVSTLIKSLEHAHDFLAGGRVQIPCGF